MANSPGAARAKSPFHSCRGGAQNCHLSAEKEHTHPTCPTLTITLVPALPLPIVLLAASEPTLSTIYTFPDSFGGKLAKGDILGTVTLRVPTFVFFTSLHLLPLDQKQFFFVLICCFFKGRDRSLIFWFILQMPTRTETGPDQNQEPRIPCKTPSGLPWGWQRLKDWITFTLELPHVCLPLTAPSASCLSLGSSPSVISPHGPDLLSPACCNASSSECQL